MEYPIRLKLNRIKSNLTECKYEYFQILMSANPIHVKTTGRVLITLSPISAPVVWGLAENNVR